MLPSDTIFIIVDVALRGIMIKPLLLIWLISLCLVRRRNDPARVAFSYLNAACPFLMVCLTLFVAGDAVAIAQTTLEQDDETNNLLSDLQYRVYSVGYLFQVVADILTVCCLVELGNGLLLSVKQQRTAFQTVLRYVAIGVGSLIFVLSLAQFSIDNVQYTNYFNYLNHRLTHYDYGGDTTAPTFDYASFDHSLTIALDLSVTCDVLLLVTTAATLGYAAYVLHQCRSCPGLRNSTVLFLVATILSLLRYSWAIAIDTAWELPNVTMPLVYADIVDPIINIWTFFVILVLLFVIGRRKQDGVWSTPQQWMSPDIMSQPGGQPPQQWMNPDIVPQYVEQPPQPVIWQSQQPIAHPSEIYTELAPPSELPGWQNHQLEMPASMYSHPVEYIKR
ncbi:hypothetical protein BGW36DRAFT_382207 [Talaromyces proteolyticus]|uniref:Uncharacterized protein n=1 Tax=Talaromyces proteolyticus TaxID=1131652 RepID=A0AAD4KMY2_9EURO|nr:uncharacterized protein BGW36DRAFT_382207 [Talaromyces proteolyticus]KAH8695154.1 hypothetical protein BGW36DRAFT_382207 [Talaromyces proteolyticus]